MDETQTERSEVVQQAALLQCSIMLNRLASPVFPILRRCYFDIPFVLNAKGLLSGTADSSYGGKAGSR
jgi:hypothetical protein